MRFIKMHGLGNDFVILDLRDGMSPPERQKLAALTDRKTGIGCDQLILLLPPRTPNADLFMKILNAPDAEEAEACGNATRCVASLIMNENGKDMAAIETIAGTLRCWKEPDGRITADMGEPKFGWQDIPLSEEADTLYLPINLDLNPSPASLRSAPSPIGRGKRGEAERGEGLDSQPVGINVGNPHAVFFVRNIENIDVAGIGPEIETHPLFPKKINVEFVEVRSPKELRMRVWERNAGETHACGTGACATLIAAVRRGLAERKADVVLDGGMLTIHWREQDNRIHMTGPATFVFDGKLNSL